MKKILLAAAALGALMATPAFAGGTHVNVGFYSPAPVYYAPPVAYYPPVNHVYYAPRPVYYTAYNYRYHDRGHHRHGRPYYTAWNDRGPRGGWNGHR